MEKNSWTALRPTTPAFTAAAYGSWLGLVPSDYELTFTDLYSPGRFHSFENRWALNAAFDWMMMIGKGKVVKRTVELSTRLKNGIKSISHIKLLTPTDPSLSAGINCFDVDSLNPDDVVKKLLRKPWDHC